MKGLTKLMRKNRLLKVLLILIMCVSIFSATNHSKNVEAADSYTNTGSLDIVTNGTNFTLFLDNFDTNNLKSFSFTLKLKQGGEPKATWINDSVDDTFFQSDTKHEFTGLVSGTDYTIDYTIKTIDPDSVYGHQTENGKEVWFYNTKRLIVEKNWDDEDNVLNERPSATNYQDMIHFYINDSEVTPRLITLAEEGKYTFTDRDYDYGYYVYYVYGLDIGEKIEFKEDDLTGYKINESIENKPNTVGFFDDYGNINESSPHLNVSRPSLTNSSTDFTPLNIKLRKIDGDTSAPLANVEFEIVNGNESNITYKGKTYAKGEVIATIVTDNSGKASIEKLLGTATYIVRESKNPNPGYESPTYTKTITFADVNNSDQETVDLGDIENKKADPISLSGKKTWNDNGDTSKRPQSITVNLLADGEPALDSSNQPIKKVVTENDGWEYTFENLPVSNGSADIVYSVSEDAVDGYDVTYDGLNITNTPAVEKVIINIHKDWDDDGDAAQKRPSEIVVELLADGDLVETITLNEDTDWSYESDNLPKYNGDKLIEYDIKEIKVPDNYSVTYDKDKENYSFVITNTYSEDPTPDPDPTPEPTPTPTPTPEPEPDPGKGLIPDKRKITPDKPVPNTSAK